MIQNGKSFSMKKPKSGDQTELFRTARQEGTKSEKNDKILDKAGTPGGSI